jgi:hypothetical protein
LTAVVEMSASTGLGAGRVLYVGIEGDGDGCKAHPHFLLLLGRGDDNTVIIFRINKSERFRRGI